MCLATHSSFTDDHRVIIDLSDWESTSDEENEEKEEEGESSNVENTAGGT